MNPGSTAGTDPAQSVCGSVSVASKVVSGSVPVLVMKTRHLATCVLGGIEYSVSVDEAQLGSVSGVDADGSHWLSVGIVQIWSTAEMEAPAGGIFGCTIAVAAGEVGEVAVPDAPVPEAETVCTTVDGTGVTGLV